MRECEIFNEISFFIQYNHPQETYYNDSAIIL